MTLERELLEFLREKGAVEMAELTERFFQQGFTREQIQRCINRLYLASQWYERPHGVMNAFPEEEGEENRDAKMPEAPEIVKPLVEKANLWLEDSIQTIQLEYILEQCLYPIFEAFGWDVHNKQGAEDPDLVLHDPGFSPDPDISDRLFQLGELPVMLLRVVKNVLSIEDEIDYICRLEYDKVSSSVPVAILTNYKEMVVYRRREPCLGGHRPVYRALYLRSSQYVKRWDELYNHLSKEVHVKGMVGILGDLEG